MLTLTTNVSRYRLEQQMQNAENFDQWKLAALKHDNVSGFERWKSKEASSSYDYQSIRERLDTIKRLRKEKDDIGLLFALNEGIHGNQAGIGNPELYNRAKFGTKQLIENYVDEIVAALLHISNLPENDDITREDKIDFFERASHCFGRSALMLSGAGSIGYFHLGVIKTLFKHQILPTVISGSSAGAIFAAILGTLNDDALHEFFSGDRIYDPLRSTNAAKSKGVTREQVDAAMLTAMLENLIPDMTFQEAYEKTGRMISITIAPVEEHQTSRLMNAITSPNVFIRSAVMASCAVPG
ncbi:MAG: patatin-like phospholipase family protein, partial [Pseudomonadota bacterium]